MHFLDALLKVLSCAFLRYILGVLRYLKGRPKQTLPSRMAWSSDSISDDSCDCDDPPGPSEEAEEAEGPSPTSEDWAWWNSFFEPEEASI